LAERRRGLVRLTYPDGAVARVPRGASVLEASRMAGIPHASVCGGRGRCSTCRVRLLGEPAHLPAPSAAERAVLDRIRAGAGVRLACQVRPTGDMAVAPLLPPRIGATELGRRREVAGFGEERFVAALFVDMRGSTRLAERRLPFDTVFVINRFLEAVGGGVAAAGGQPNQILGDGMMALFGVADEPEAAARQALEAVGRIAARIDALNAMLGGNGEEPIRFGLGLHAGTAILGEIGDREHGRAVFTAIGDPVNVASRLQGLTKGLGCEALISAAVFEAAGVRPDLTAREFAIEGRDGRLAAYPLDKASEGWREAA
jgi:adenylate cyclase